MKGIPERECPDTRLHRQEADAPAGTGRSQPLWPQALCRGIHAPVFGLALLLIPTARAADTPAPRTYVSAASLHADATVGPDPFAWAPAGSTPVTLPMTDLPPANVAYLTLLRPYTVSFNPRPALVLEPPNPFPDLIERTAPKLHAPPEEAADWNRVWPVTWTDTAYAALEEAWDRNPVAMRKAFRDETKRDWPLEGTTAADEVSRIAASRWVEGRWNSAVQGQIAAWKTTNAIRGPVVTRAPMDGALSILSAGDAADFLAPIITPRVTGDASVNQYGLGFLLRVTSDLGARIPWPLLDLSGLSATDAEWGRRWLDEAVRNGVRGLDILPPNDRVARAVLESAVKPLETPNVYLPPPSEIGIFVSLDTLARERGAWVSLFRAYAALRSAGLWPDFISDQQVRTGEVPLARFTMVVLPAARWASGQDERALLAVAERGGIVVITDRFAFHDNMTGFAGWAADNTQPDGRAVITPAPGVRTLKRYPDGAPSVTERRVGDGAILAAGMDVAEPDMKFAPFWRQTARRAAVPNRPWLDAVTAANVGRVTGLYQKPESH